MTSILRSVGALFAIGVALAAWLPSGTRAQEIQAGDEARAGALRVFLDCSGGREVRFDFFGLESLEGGLDLRQPWGGGSVRASASMYLHDTTENRLSLGGGVNVRIFRGLSWNVSGNIARVHDQLYLPLGDIPPEEILVQRDDLLRALDIARLIRLCSEVRESWVSRPFLEWGIQHFCAHGCP